MTPQRYIKKTEVPNLFDGFLPFRGSLKPDCLITPEIHAERCWTFIFFRTYDFLRKYCTNYEDDALFLDKHNADTLAMLQQIADDYFSILKDMAYINCTQSETGYNDPYLHTSVSTNLYSLKKDAFYP